MVRLEALDDGRQVRVGVQLAGGLAARLGVRAQLVPADLEDRVRVQVPEGAQADQLVVALATQRPVLGGGRQRPVHPDGVVVERLAGAVDRAVQPGQLPGVQDLLGGLPHLGEEARQVLRVAELHLLPQADLGPDRPAARLREEGGDALETVRDALDPLRQGRGSAGEQREHGVADVPGGLRPALPAADLVRVEQRQADVVELQVPLEPRGGGQPGRIERLDGGEMALLLGDLVLDGVPAGVAQAVVLAVDPEVGGHDRVVGEQAPDAGLDEVVEAVVERAGVGRGRRSREILAAEQCRHGSSGAAGARRRPGVGRGAPQAVPATIAAGLGSVSRRASAAAATTLSTSSAVTPRCVTARICPWG